MMIHSIVSLSWRQHRVGRCCCCCCHELLKHCRYIIRSIIRCVVVCGMLPPAGVVLSDDTTSAAADVAGRALSRGCEVTAHTFIIDEMFFFL